MDEPAEPTQSEMMHREAAQQAVSEIAQLARTWPVKRAWLPLNKRATSAAAISTASPVRSSPLLRLVSYNLLAQHLIRRNTFPYCSKQTLRLHHRRQQLTAELLHYDADIYALQEVDADHFEQHYQPLMGERGYDGRFGTAEDKMHGCALFFKRDKFEAVDYELVQYAEMAQEYADEQTQHELNKANVGQILSLQLRQQGDVAADAAKQSTPLGLVITNHHCFWHPPHRFVRLRQCERLLTRAHSASQQHHFPFMLAGDWNITPSTHIYNWLLTRQLERQYWYKYVKPVRNNNGKYEEPTPSKPEDERCDEAEERAVLGQEQQSRHERFEDMQRLLDRSQSLPLLASAYADYTSLVPPFPPQPYCDWQGEPPFTNYTQGWKGTLDYIFTARRREEQQQQLATDADNVAQVEVDSILELPGLDLVSSETALPNEQLGSDHCAIACQFRLIGQ